MRCSNGRQIRSEELKKIKTTTNNNKPPQKNKQKKTQNKNKNKRIRKYFCHVTWEQKRLLIKCAFDGRPVATTAGCCCCCSDWCSAASANTTIITAAADFNIVVVLRCDSEIRPTASLSAFPQTLMCRAAPPAGGLRGRRHGLCLRRGLQTQQHNNTIFIKYFSLFNRPNHPVLVVLGLTPPTRANIPGSELPSIFLTYETFFSALLKDQTSQFWWVVNHWHKAWLRPREPRKEEYSKLVG